MVFGISFVVTFSAILNLNYDYIAIGGGEIRSTQRKLPDNLKSLVTFPDPPSRIRTSMFNQSLGQERVKAMLSCIYPPLPSSYDVCLPSVITQVQVSAGYPSGLAWSLYKCAALWTAVYGASVTERSLGTFL